MMTITRQQAANSLLMEYLAQRHILQEKMDVMGKRFGCSLAELEKKFSGQTERFADWDAFIEWKSYQAALDDFNSKISEIEHGEFSLA